MDALQALENMRNIIETQTRLTLPDHTAMHNCYGVVKAALHSALKVQNDDKDGDPDAAGD